MIYSCYFNILIDKLYYRMYIIVSVKKYHNRRDINSVRVGESTF